MRSPPRSSGVPASPEPIEPRWSGDPRPTSPHAPLGHPLRLRSPPSGRRLLRTRSPCRDERLRPQTRDRGASPRRVPTATPNQAGAPREAGARPRRPPPAGHVGQSFGRPRASQRVSLSARFPQRLCSSAPAPSSRLSHSNRQRPASFGRANGTGGAGLGGWRGGARQWRAGLDEPALPPSKDLSRVCFSNCSAWFSRAPDRSSAN